MRVTLALSSSWTRTLTVLCGAALSTAFSQTPLPKFPMGMNIHGVEDYQAPVFNDAFMQAREWITFDLDSSAWSTGLESKMSWRSDGYPSKIPQILNGRRTALRGFVSNLYTGEFVFTHDGAGEISFNVTNRLAEGKRILTLDGKGGNAWFQILRSEEANPIRNIRILPVALAAGYDKNNPEHVFYAPFLKGLKGMQSLRFMDWQRTNGSLLKTWSDRPTPDYFSQGAKGASIEHALMLSNHLKVDPWFCVPHGADDDFIRRFADLVATRLDPGLKVYVEYSNELWNWGFAQAQWVIHNGQWGMTDPAMARLLPHDTLVAQLKAVALKYCQDEKSTCHPEKDAHMAMRALKIWRGVFASKGQSARLLTALGAQTGWQDNTRRMLQYYKDQNFKVDLVALTSYFNFTEADHLKWNAMAPAQVTPAMVVEAARKDVESPAYKKMYTDHAGFCKEFGCKLAMYEGGQHMQAWQQGDYPYNPAVFDAQVHPGMYDLQVRAWTLIDEALGKDLVIHEAFSYVGARKSKYGSWGHLENYEQLSLSPAALRQQAPKWAALQDMMLPKGSTSLRRAPAAAAQAPKEIRFEKGSIRYRRGAETRNSLGQTPAR